MNLRAVPLWQFIIQSPPFTDDSSEQRRNLGAICGIVIACILVAGLWPFQAPKNRVDWLTGENGLHFGREGSILTSGAIGAQNSPEDQARTVEIWLRADSLDRSSGTILAFYVPQNPFVPFSLRQFKDSLVLQHEFLDQQQHVTKKSMGVLHVLRRDRFVLVTIASGARGTAVYADGLPIETSAGFKLPLNDFSGRLVVGNSGADDDSWAGDVRGLAIYGKSLTPAQVLRHSEAWTSNGHPDSIASEAPLALYLFDERSGSAVHDQLGSSNVLRIPGRYFLLHHRLLTSPWEGYRNRWSYWKDVCVNVAGFVPLGFFLSTYFWSANKAGWGVVATIIIGFSISLTIELLQALLPTRDSGATDLITNTLGTGVGVLLCNSVLARLRPSSG